MFMFILATSLLTLFVERIFGGKKCISIDQSCFTKLVKGCVICQPMVALNQKLMVSSVLDTSTTVSSWFLAHFRLLRFSFWTLFPGRLLQTLVLVNSSVMLISFSFSVMGIVITFPLAILKRKALASLCIDCNNKR